MGNRDFNMPSVEELYALEGAPHREMAKLLRRAFEGKGQKGLRHA